MTSFKDIAYCQDYYNRHRFETKTVAIGKLKIGGNNPVLIQSMTTTDTMDTDSSINQTIRMVDAGCELVRLTAPSKKEAENLRLIKKGLKKKKYSIPLVADIHFTPNAAEIAALHVEKVRVNPGNYADKKKFENIEYTDESYNTELVRIEKKFTPLVLLCKDNGTAMRIGVNHGSLSDRILSRFGDTPEGMVASAMEFLNICEKNNYKEVVLSMKASNTIVMVQAYRLLVATMIKNNMKYPLHLGVTEAGEGEDGRIKSAVGIGALLEDGIGDTIRVSLTEKPEAEIPVAKKLIEKFNSKNDFSFSIPQASTEIKYNPYHYEKRNSSTIKNIGGHEHPIVLADISSIDKIKHAHFFGFGYQYSVPLDKWTITDTAADIVYIGKQSLDISLPGTLKVLVDFNSWKNKYSQKPSYYPLINKVDLDHPALDNTFFIIHKAEDFEVEYLLKYPKAIVVLESKYTNKTQLFRKIQFEFAKYKILNPVILCASPTSNDDEQFQLWSASDLGPTLIDGFGDGVWLKGNTSVQNVNSTSFGILQATRTRISKTEYISCPSCGRTLFDLEETTAKIRKETSHLKGLKIGIMGCIVNGPGEMADADYGYVGTGPGKIHLYKEQEVVHKNILENDAVEALINLIKENGDWVEPKEV